MLYFKIAGAVLVMLSSILLYLSINDKDKKRICFLEDYYVFFEELKAQVEKYPIPIEQILKQKKEGASKLLFECLSDVLKNIDEIGLQEAWNTCFKNILSKADIPKLDIQTVICAGEYLTADKPEVLSANISVYLVKLKQYMDKIIPETKKKSELNKKLFPLIALAVIIMLL